VDYFLRQIARLCSLSGKISWRKSSSPMTAVVPTQNSNWLTVFCESADITAMNDLCRLAWCAMVGLARSRAPLQAETLVLRHQLNV
jgi:hypothetical protein